MSGIIACLVLLLFYKQLKRNRKFEKLLDPNALKFLIVKKNVYAFSHKTIVEVIFIVFTLTYEIIIYSNWYAWKGQYISFFIRIP